ncbi:unnamed protein product [Owenia fusiformis]|uniref:Uncharacterized protein n=1 Tax=Owenia fusiformis TaxID=6347 RepID=A0A8J1THX1_OWEFU|nr:unnamed protein product [Owenia fusiformis]
MALYFTAATVILSISIHGYNAKFPDAYISDFIPENYKDEYMEVGGRNKRSVVFSGVEPEGEEVLNRLNNIMNNASISAESKQRLEAALSSIGKGQSSGGGDGIVRGRSFGKSGIAVHRGSIGVMDKRLWPVDLRPMTTPRPQLHATQCCCKVAVPPLSRLTSRRVTRSRSAYRRVRAGSRRCGFAGWRRCTQWRNQQYPIYYHQTVYTAYYTQRLCPKDKEVCCRGFVPYKRCCTNIREMKRLLDLFEHQRDQFDSLREFLIAQGHNPDAGCPKSCGP